MKRKTLAEHAYDHVMEHRYSGIMWGDITMIHDIIDRAGGKHRGPRTCRVFLQSLEGSPLFKKHHVLIDGHWVRDFRPIATRPVQPEGEGK